ncbi:MAG: transglutaminase-like domain-containing protein, partial [Deltaproteobacteria bacterium]|nr:transglutaminase-like domain-containing protein [Deltaproteobacteria bacterium]
MENSPKTPLQFDRIQKKVFFMSKRAACFGLFLFFVLFTCVATLAATVPAGPIKGAAPLVSPYEAQKTLARMTVEKITLKGLDIPTTEATPEIKELARGLKNDPDLIYQYVHDHIEYTPIFGSLKGATATLLDEKGNDFDQSSLMIALLREAGYTANFVYGIIRLNPEQITNWLGLNDNPRIVSKFFALAGIPATVEAPGGNLEYVELIHVWVTVDIDGNNYVFDPSFKIHTYKSPIDLASAMNYDRNAFLAEALKGTVITSDYIRNVNRVEIRKNLARYATNLIQHIRNNHPAATLEDIIGGSRIVPAEDVLRQTSLPYEQSKLGEWTEFPDHVKTILKIEHSGIDETFYASEIYGKRLTIFYNSSNQPVLRLDGTVIATGNSTNPGGRYGIILSVDHPYLAGDGKYADQSMTLHVKAGGSYFIVNGWTETGRGMIEKHRKLLKENIHAGDDPTSEPVLGETLAMIGYGWAAEASRSDEVADRIANTFTIHHHFLGVCGQMESPYIDMPMQFVAIISKEDDVEKENSGFYSATGHHSAFEWGVFDQMQPYSAVSTVKLIDISNNKSDRIFDAISANYESYVKPRLVNYDSIELAQVEAYINAGYRVILPQDGNLGEQQWTGTGYIAISSFEDQIWHIIGGGLSGGYGTESGTADPEHAIHSTNQGNQSGENQIICSLPVDAVIGNQLYEHHDLTVGSSSYPIGLEFMRSYNSGMRLDDGLLGLGWAHNFHTAARVDSDGLQGMGEDSPVDAAAAIVEQYVANDILYGNKNIERVVTATVAHRWFMDQLIDNMVSVSEPGYTKRFSRLPDGSYN